MAPTRNRTKNTPNCNSTSLMGRTKGMATTGLRYVSAAARLAKSSVGSFPSMAAVQSSVQVAATAGAEPSSASAAATGGFRTREFSSGSSSEVSFGSATAIGGLMTRNSFNTPYFSSRMGCTQGMATRSSTTNFRYVSPAAVQSSVQVAATAGAEPSSASAAAAGGFRTHEFSSGSSSEVSFGSAAAIGGLMTRNSFKNPYFSSRMGCTHGMATRSSIMDFRYMSTAARFPTSSVISDPNMAAVQSSVQVAATAGAEPSSASAAATGGLMTRNSSLIPQETMSKTTARHNTRSRGVTSRAGATLQAGPLGPARNRSRGFDNSNPLASRVPRETTVMKDAHTNTSPIAEVFFNNVNFNPPTPTPHGMKSSGVSPPPRPVVACPVCLITNIEKEMYTMSCGHIFCKECITREAICPICRVKIIKGSIHAIYF